MERNSGRAGFTVQTSDGVIEAQRIVAATGPFQKPVIPAIAPYNDRLTQIHSADYRNPQPLRMPLHLAFSYDEEVGCLGVRSLVAHLRASPEKPALCIIGEPTGMQPVYCHKGKVAMRCEVRGHACHSVYAPSGVNAIEQAAKLIGHITGVSESLQLTQDKRFDPPFSTLQVGTIQGGAALNIVPQDCKFDFELHTLPDAYTESVLENIRAFARSQLLPAMHEKAPDSAITFQPLGAYPGLLTDPKSDFARWLERQRGVFYRCLWHRRWPVR